MIRGEIVNGIFTLKVFFEQVGVYIVQGLTITTQLQFNLTRQAP
jgi:hypothetical protein